MSGLLLLYCHLLGDCDVEITFRIKEFCSSQSTSDFLLCEMSTVLRGLFFLMINCLFSCFDSTNILSNIEKTVFIVKRKTDS